MVNIKVAVRIRPLSRRESLQGEEVIVRKENNSVLVTNSKIPEGQDGDSRQRTWRFTVDFCYDPYEPEGCTQGTTYGNFLRQIYGEIGSEVLSSMFEGYNACIMAYGHSASGKTYTIMGTEDDPGLTPRLCLGLFDELDKRHLHGRIRFQVLVSFFEIYNEKVRDLLRGEETLGDGCNFSLRVREHPKLGPYVQGLSEHLVTEKRKLLDLLTTGNRRRSTAATENNTHSSRSHALFTLQFKQCDGVYFETEKSSKIYLVDLAGSERASSSQSKERLKEGANINKSLVTLGNVVSALAESCEASTRLKAQPSSKSWNPFVPYRDSVLTWLLKDTLGGNSNTIMIATISPAGSCLSETINTLRYAKRTKRIVNRPIVNEDPKIRTIRQLRREIARLKHLLLSYQLSGTCSGIEENNKKQAMLFSIPESKCLDSGEAKITNKEVCPNENKKKQKPFSRDSNQSNNESTSGSETGNGLKDYESDENRKKNIEDTETSTPNGCEKGILGQGAALSEDYACKVNDEKKSDVNGSVNDNFSHETQIFSDSLESFPSVFLKSGKAYDSHDGARRPKTDKNEYKIRETSGEKFEQYIMRDLSLCKNLSENKAFRTLHRSRPDLIKGISSRSKKGPPSSSSQSCTDVSNVSQSTSENSLNSSGSIDISPLEKRQFRDRRRKNVILQGDGGNIKERGGEKKEDKNETLRSASKTTEKQSGIVEGVTSRLYGMKNKADRRGMVAKQQIEEDGELESLKMCKRARMKLFDLSRKLAMTRKLKKTVDNDTQTDSITATLRVKEKSVITDSKEASGIEGFEFDKENFEKEKPYVIMNQVFIPRASKYVVECGNVVRIEVPETADKHESATQTAREDLRPCKNANTSPIKFYSLDEDCFSEDSLDLEDKFKNCKKIIFEKQQKRDPEQKMNFKTSLDSKIYFSWDSERFREKSKGERENSNKLLFNEWPLIFFPEVKISQGEEAGIVLSDACENSSEEWREEENLSSENSFSSVDGADMSCSSETSSDDFVFHEAIKDTDMPHKVKQRDYRELYTITENSEYSDLSDALSPAQSRISSLNLPQENEPENARGRCLGEKILNGAKKYDRPMHAKGKKIREKSIESKRAPLEIKRENSTQNSDKICTDFMKTSKSNEIKGGNLEVPKPTSLFTIGPISEGSDRVPIYAKDSGSANETEIIYSNSEDIRCRLRGTKADLNPTSWMNLHSNPQKQYLNLNVPHKCTTTGSGFSVDAHMFGKDSQKDESADAMFSSSDSITFVFMGPAKPKTSVLMEIIRRSLDKTLSSEESHSVQRKSKTKGVQCDKNLIRSVSIDSAMIALSRVGKIQELSSGMRRAASLRALSPNETPTILDKNSNWESVNLEDEKCTSVLNCSIRHANSVERIKEEKTQEAEKAKKSVSWGGETKCKMEKEWKKPNFDVNYRDSPELESEDSNKGIPSGFPPQRRVRFLKGELENLGETGTNQTQETEHIRPVDPLGAFLKEATQLLKHINFCSSKYPEFSSEAVEKQVPEEIHHIKGKSVLKTTNSKTTNHPSPEKNADWMWRVAPEQGLKKGNLTWPRTRASAGKPPTGNKAKFPSVLPSQPDFLHPNDCFDLTKNFSRSALKGSKVESWKVSNLSLPPGKIQCRFSGSQPSWWRDHPKCGCIGDSFSPPLAGSFMPNVPTLNFVSLAELEKNVEESCRRLEMATERDRTRESLLVGEKMSSERLKEVKLCCEAGVQEHEFKGEKAEPREVIKRRKPEKCAGSCTCRTTRIETCEYLWSKGCRSNFELDSFGPGSMHCHQLCMFCRKKDAEMYYSALSLNSKCFPNLCRLSFYGFCPCSSVRLTRVASSPRAYMQRLLALRRQIVSQAGQEQLDPKSSKVHRNEGKQNLHFFY